MTHELNLKETQKEWHGTFSAYVIGFLLSLLLTLLSFGLVISRILSGTALVSSLTVLAILQALVQLLCFLHLRKEAKPRWELALFYFMLLMLLIVVIGSLWIMYDLNQRVMSPMNHD